MRVLLTVLVVLLLVVTPVVADGPNEMYLQVEKSGEVRLWVNDTLPQEHWSQLRVAADQNEDGHVSDAEASMFEEVYREELENHPSQQTTLNGHTVASVSASIHVVGLRGPVADTDPIIARAEARLGYPVSEGADELVWQRVPYEDEAGRNFSLSTPSGWVVASHDGLVDPSSTPTQVMGQIGGETLVVVMVPQEVYEEWMEEKNGEDYAEKINPDGTQADDKTSTGADGSQDDEGDDAVELVAPGWIAVSLLLVAVAALRRRSA